MFREFLDAVADAILIVDQEGKIVRINRAAETLFGYRPNEMVGQSIHVLVPPQSRDKHRQNMSAYLKDPQARLMSSGLEQFATRKQGGEFPVEVSLGPVGNAESQAVICIVRDISSRRQSESELREQRRQLVEQRRKLQAVTAKLVLVEEHERRRISIGLHDDVGQTLAAAKLNLGELLERNMPADGESSAREALRLVEQAIQTTRTLTFELASAALYEVGLEAALQSACERAELESGIRFLPPENSHGPPIPEPVRIIIYRSGRELIRNILKHSKAQSARISLTLSGDRLRMTVEDDGCGFEVSKGLLDPNVSGFGLLSISQQLEQFGGGLEIVSTPGSGTRAVITVFLDSMGDGA